MKAALIGHGISASLTPKMHMAEARALGVDYQYDVIDTHEPKFGQVPLAELVEATKAEGMVGLNTTHPFKLQAALLADKLIGAAAELASVNTLVFEGDQIIGHNTDYVGFRSALIRELPAADMRHVLLAGAGGAGRSVALALIDQGARRLTITDTDISQAARLADLLRSLRPGADVRAVLDVESIGFSTLSGFVNATPMGMKSHPGAAVDVGLLPKTSWVSDIVYLPLDTTLLKRARMRGLRTMTGAGMAVFQAVAAFSLITGHSANAARMRAHFEAEISKQQQMSEKVGV